MGVENIIKVLRNVYCLFLVVSQFLVNLNLPNPINPERFIVFFRFGKFLRNLKIRFLGNTHDQV
jgi:hypothetical protein